MSKNSINGGGGIGFIGLLTIVFITLKLTNVIAWSWWMILAPMWSIPVLILVVVMIAGVVEVISQGRR